MFGYQERQIDDLSRKKRLTCAFRILFSCSDLARYDGPAESQIRPRPTHFLTYGENRPRKTNNEAKNLIVAYLQGICHPHIFIHRSDETLSVIYP